MLQFEKVFFPNSVRSFSTSKAAYVKSVWRKTWPTFKERLAQQNLEEKRFPIPRKAQDKRLPWGRMELYFCGTKFAKVYNLHNQMTSQFE